MSKRSAYAARVAALAVALTTAGVPAARATTGEESRFTSLTNAARADHGQAAYAVAYDLVAVARRHAQRMAAAHRIYHNPALTSEVSNWQAVGENVGAGWSVESIHQALMNSPSHRENILDRDFTQVGIGTAHDSDGRLYVTEVFRQPYSARAVAPPRPVTQVQHRTYRAPRPAPVRRPAAPDGRTVLVRKLASAKAVYAKAEPRTSVEHATTYVRVMVSLL